MKMKEGAYGLANIETGSPVERDSVFEIASPSAALVLAVPGSASRAAESVQGSLDLYLQALEPRSTRALHVHNVRAYPKTKGRNEVPICGTSFTTAKGFGVGP